MRNLWQKILFFSSGLRDKFVVYFSVMTIVPLIVMGALAIRVVNVSHALDISQLEKQLIDNKVAQIDKFFVDTINILELRVSIENKVDITLSEQEFILNGLLEENEAFQEVAFINLYGDETSKIHREVSDEQLHNVKGLTYFQEAAKGKSYLGDVFFNSNGPRMMMAAPVINRNGQIIQVLAAEVSLEPVDALIQDAHLGEKGYVFLTNTDGRLISFSGDQTVSLGKNLSSLSRVRDVLEGKSTDGLQTSDRYKSYFGDVPVVGASRLIPRVKWGLLVEWPVVDADAIITTIRHQVVTVTLIGIIAAFLLSSFIAARLVLPIRKLQTFADNVGKGTLNKQIEIATGDELDDLASSLNSMAQGLARLNELKNEFVFVAAHELRTPVTAIKGFLALTLDRGEKGKETLSERTVHDITRAKQANDRLIQLVNDLLEIARSDAGRLKIEVKPVNIFFAINALIEELQPLADERNITLIYEKSEIPDVMADPQKLNEIITNLISNAVKYNKEGGSITISHEIDKDAVVTHVSDTGIGLTKEELSHLFEKFYRAENDDTREVMGTGLGLYIVKELVERMDGYIWCESERGKGTTFSFRLPRVKE